jgi:predicted DNA-binding WGR domain protein
MKKIKLYQKARTGKTKFIELSVEKNRLITVWGLEGGKTQRTEKICQPTNTGRSNARDGHEQALAEMTSKITEKREEGYGDSASEITTLRIAQLDDLPTNFCPCKPIQETPQSVIDSPDTYGQRKDDGHCIILTNGKTPHMYTRRIENRDDRIKLFAPVLDQMIYVPPKSLVLSELFFERTSIKKQVATDIGPMLSILDYGELKERYAELQTLGVVGCTSFDMMFFKGKFIGDLDYLERYKIMQDCGLNVPPIIKDWRAYIPTAKKLKWEGFVLRVPGERSYIEYTLNGKPHRCGSYKFKFTCTDDFFVTEALYGKAGKHASLLCKFRIGQYDKNGHIIDRAYVGPGTLTHAKLAEITEQIETKKLKIPFTVEIEYQSLQPDSGAFQFGQILRLREDKAPNECVFDE